MTTTVCVQIGNSDNKLTQQQWAEFFVETQRLLESMAEQMYFSGHSEPAAKWQNACFVGAFDDAKIGALKNELHFMRKKYNQKSAAVVVGNVEFV